MPIRRLTKTAVQGNFPPSHTGSATNKKCLSKPFHLVINRLRSAVIMCIVTGLFWPGMVYAEHLPHGEAAMEFDGEEDFVEIDHSESLQLTEGGTIEAWIYISGPGHGTWPRILSKSHSTGSDGGWELLLDGDDQLRFQTAGAAETLPEPLLESERWYHAAVSFDGDEWAFYVDGKEAGRYQESALPPEDDSQLIIADAAGGSRKFEGRIQDVRIWSTIRTPEQIRGAMGRELEGDEEGLEACWPLSGNTIKELVEDRETRAIGDSKWVLACPFDTDLLYELKAEPSESITLGPVELRNPQGEVKYQWYFSGEPVEGAVDSILEIPDLTVKDHGTYYVEVDDERDLTPVESTRLHFKEWPMWESNLVEGKSVSQGDDATLGPVELYAPLGEISYQWFLNEEAVEGALESSLELEDITNKDLRNYYVEVGDES